jgi:hypothetical protein
MCHGLPLSSALVSYPTHLPFFDPRASAQIRGKSSQPFEQLCQLNLEALGKLLHAEKRQVALSALYLPDVGPMQANLLLCSLL